MLEELPIIPPGLMVFPCHLTVSLEDFTSGVFEEQEYPLLFFALPLFFDSGFILASFKTCRTSSFGTSRGFSNFVCCGFSRGCFARLRSF
jgi:hypothetical protein